MTEHIDPGETTENHYDEHCYCDSCVAARRARGGDPDPFVQQNQTEGDTP
jgi:hypothetical protein